MRQMLLGGKILTLFVARDQRNQLLQLERDLNDMVSTVDQFYALLGPRHWIFTGNLPLPEVKDVVEAGLTPDAAESRIIDIIGDRIRSEWWRSGLFGHPAM